MFRQPGIIALRRPLLLHILCGDDISCGANQRWYPYWRARLSGCGPTTAANLLWYLAATRPQRCGALFTGDARHKPQMVTLMRQVWRFVRPAPWGMARGKSFVRGARRYGASRGVSLQARLLSVPTAAARRPSAEQLHEFLVQALADDLPVAFLNRNNGAVRNLPGWHWVTLVEVQSDLQAVMYDQSGRHCIDLACWLATTRRGGAFVALQPQDE